MQEEAQEAVLGYQTGINTKVPDRDRKPRRPYIPCPECKKLMNTKNFSGCSGIVMDYCRDHGRWFDRGELQKIISFVKNGGLRKAREREIEDLKNEEDRLRVKQLEATMRERRIDTLAGDYRSTHSNEDPSLKIISDIFSILE